MHLKIETGMFEQLSKTLKIDGIHIFVGCNLFDFMQNLLVKKCGNIIIHFFCSNIHLWMKKMTLFSLFSALILKVK